MISRLLSQYISKTQQRFIKPKALCEKSLWEQNKWLRDILSEMPIEYILTEESTLEKFLISLGDASLALIFLDSHNISGLRASVSIESKVNKIHSITPNVGVLIVANFHSSIQPFLLPPRTWIIMPKITKKNLTSILQRVQNAKEDQVELARKWPECWEKVVSESFSERKPEMPLLFRPIPNFNIKNPAMLVPIAKTASLLKTPVFCEISPQEALVFYFNSVPGSCKDKVKKVLHEIKYNVDFVHNQTGAQIYLHLDHCNDPELLLYAMDIGFDSIMADGSARYLRGNIEFTSKAVQYAKRFGIPVEGEVGVISSNNQRNKVDKNLVANIKEFILATGVDYVAANLGQSHSCDYGFDRARNAWRQIMELKEKHQYDDVLSLYKASQDIDQKLALLDFSKSSIERQWIRNLQQEIALGKSHCFLTYLEDAIQKLPLSAGYWITSLKCLWQEYRMQIYEQEKKLYAQIVGTGVMPSENHHESGLNFELLTTVSSILPAGKNSLVIHGGSSIGYSELCLLKHYPIGRINFGSSLFIAFLNSVAARNTQNPSITLHGDPISSSRFLTEFTSDWKDWIENPPFFLDAFQEELANRYFLPFKVDKSLFSSL